MDTLTTVVQIFKHSFFFFLPYILKTKYSNVVTFTIFSYFWWWKTSKFASFSNFLVLISFFDENFPIENSCFKGLLSSFAIELWQHMPVKQLISFEIFICTKVIFLKIQYFPSPNYAIFKILKKFNISENNIISFKAAKGSSRVYLSRVHSIYHVDTCDTLFSPLIPNFSRDGSDWNSSMELCLSPPCWPSYLDKKTPW